MDRKLVDELLETARNMGGYHGRHSFDTFTHYRSIVRKGTWLDLPVRYRPYTAVNEKLLKFLMH